MIVAKTPGGYRFITQPDHADLAGEFAERWGNDSFGVPEPSGSVELAATRHDDGWRVYDRRPHLDGDGTPIDFRDVPADPWVALYEAGIRGVVEDDRYAGLLVSMHGAGLRKRRYGLSPNWPPTAPAFEAFVDRQEALQARLARELFEADPGRRVSEADLSLLSTLHGTGSAPASTRSRLWYHYELLQAWDTLSLSFCTTVSPPGYGEIGPAPTSAGGPDETLTIEPLGGGEFRVEPYPFDTDPLVVSVPTRTVRADAFDGEAELRRAYDGATREKASFSLRS